MNRLLAKLGKNDLDLKSRPGKFRLSRKILEYFTGDGSINIFFVFLV